MANETTDHNESRGLDELLTPGTTVMFGAVAASGPFETRPLTVARVDGDTVRILIDGRTDWAATLTAGDPIYLGLSDTRENNWMTLSGTASMSEDPAMIDELWSPMAGAFFDDGRETPGIAVLSVKGSEGRYWSSPSGRLGSLVSMVKAAVGDSEDSGSSGSVEL